MKKMFKQSAVIIITSLFLAVSFMSAYAVSVDGYCGNKEWEDAEVFISSEQKKLNNNIKSVIIRAENGAADGCVYMMFLIEYEKDGNIEDGAIRLRVNDGDTAEISSYGDIIADGGYDIEAAADCDELSGVAIVETAVYFIDDLTSSDEFKLNFVDLQGTESGTYTVSFDDIQQDSETDEEAETPGAKSEKAKTSKAKTSRTTKAKTTKKTTSKKGKTTEAFDFKKVDKNSTAESADGDDGKAVTHIQAEGKSGAITQQGGNSENSRKYIYAAAGSVCALGVAVAAVICAMKSNESKNKKD